METTYTPLPAELRPILLSKGSEPLHLLDGETQKVYVLIEEPPVPSMSDDELRRALQSALEEEARGESAPLDFNAIRSLGLKILAERKAPAQS